MAKAGRRLSRVQKSKAVSAVLVRLNSNIRWASRWIHLSSRTSTQALLSLVLLALARSRVATRRQPCGEF